MSIPFVSRIHQASGQTDLQPHVNNSAMVNTHHFITVHMLMDAVAETYCRGQFPRSRDAVERR
jgi:hypothetical protein